MNIFIGSLPYSVKANDLKEFFEEYGEVSSSKIITDKATGRSKGYGFIEMMDENAAKKAIDELNGAEVEGRTIVVNEAKERVKNDFSRENQRRNSGYKRY
jgi:RNA recognition motif-containing protein